jgi:hypothetical protein
MLAAEKQNKSPALAGRRKCPHFSLDEKYLYFTTQVFAKNL